MLLEFDSKDLNIRHEDKFLSSSKPWSDIQSSEFNIIKLTRDETDLDRSTFFIEMMNFKENTHILLLNCFSFRIHVPSNRLSNDDICPHENETITLKSFCQMMLVIFLSSLICAGLLFICILVSYYSSLKFETWVISSDPDGFDTPPPSIQKKINLWRQKDVSNLTWRLWKF